MCKMFCLLNHSEKISFRTPTQTISSGEGKNDYTHNNGRSNRLFLGLNGKKVVKYEDTSGFVFIFVT